MRMSEVTDRGGKKPINGYVNQMLHSYLGKVKALANTGDYATVVAGLPPFRPYQMPDLSAELLPHKRGIVAELIRRLRDAEAKQGYINVTYCLEGLRSLGVEWSELDMIQRIATLNSEHAAEVVDEHADDGEDWDPYGNDADQAASDKMELMKVAADLEHDLKYPENNSLVVLDLEEMGRLDIVWKPWLSLENLLTQERKSIIRGMITAIRGSKHPIRYINSISALENMGIAWPELDAMRQMLSSQGKVNESSDADEREGSYDRGRGMVIDAMRSEADDGARGIFYMIYHMDHLNMNITDWPELGEIIDSRKRDIMADLMKSLRPATDENPQGPNIEHVDTILSRLLNIGVRWPQLDVLRGHIDSNMAAAVDGQG